MASETMNTELEKIQAELESKIDAKNKELSEILTKHKADMDAATGDARLEKLVIEKEIFDLEAKKNDLEGTINKALAEVTADKIKNASDFESIKSAKQELELMRQKLSEERLALELRQEALNISASTLDIETKAHEERIQESKDLIAEAIKQKEESILSAAEASKMLREAREIKQEAENSVADIVENANRILRDAEELNKKANENMASVEAQMNEALAIKDEYQKKLKESETWADENSAVANRLSVWEAALMHEKNRLQDGRAKLAIAEKDFAAKTSGGK